MAAGAALPADHAHAGPRQVLDAPQAPRVAGRQDQPLLAPGPDQPDQRLARQFGRAAGSLKRPVSGSGICTAAATAARPPAPPARPGCRRRGSPGRSPIGAPPSPAAGRGCRPGPAAASRGASADLGLARQPQHQRRAEEQPLAAQLRRRQAPRRGPGHRARVPTGAAASRPPAVSAFPAEAGRNRQISGILVQPRSGSRRDCGPPDAGRCREPA